MLLCCSVIALFVLLVACVPLWLPFKEIPGNIFIL